MQGRQAHAMKPELNQQITSAATQVSHMTGIAQQTLPVLTSAMERTNEEQKKASVD